MADDVFIRAGLFTACGLRCAELQGQGTKQQLPATTATWNSAPEVASQVVMQRLVAARAEAVAVGACRPDTGDKGLPVLKWTKAKGLPHTPPAAAGCSQPQEHAHTVVSQSSMHIASAALPQTLSPVLRLPTSLAGCSSGVDQRGPAGGQLPVSLPQPSLPHHSFAPQRNPWVLRGWCGASGRVRWVSSIICWGGGSAGA